MLSPTNFTGIKNKINDIENLYKLKKACREFEALFISQLLTEMEKTVPQDPIIKNNAANSIYKFMYINAVSQKIAEDSPFSIAKVLFNSLKEYLNNKAKLPEKINKEPIKLKTYQKFIPVDKKHKFVNEKMRIIQKAINDASKRFHVPKKLLYGIIKAESSFNPTAISKAGAIGLMQLMPQTALEMGVKNIWSIKENILGGAKYISKLINKFKDYKKALAAYNAGPKSVEKYHGIPPFKETQDYVKKVIAYMEGNY